MMLKDPYEMSHEDLAECLICIQNALWPTADHSWSADTIDTIAMTLTDAGLAPAEENGRFREIDCLPRESD